MTRGRRVLGFGAALLVGVGVGLLLWPTVKREWKFRQAFSDDATQRQIALDWWQEPVAADGLTQPRLVEFPAYAARFTERIESRVEQPIFVEVASLLRESGYWRLPLISTALWRRRLDLILESGDDAAARSVLDEVAHADAPREDENAMAVWRAVLDWPHDPEIRCSALLDAAEWFGRDHFEPLAAAARSDPDGRVRRLAWLLLGHLHPNSGYAGQWKGEEPAVAEAMLWAATVTNPDDASPLLVACDQSPWPTPALPWLLARSDDPAARARLEALVVDGNRAAALHLAERWGAGLERLPVAQQAWLGQAVASEAEADVMLARWVAWRDQPVEVGSLLDDPVAKDGSNWAAVLLAERLLDESARLARAHDWMASLSIDVRRAGFVLLGLCGDPTGWLTQAYLNTQDPSLRRAIRLGRMVADSKQNTATQPDTERAYAWTIVMTEPSERVEALLALLASGDAEAARAVLTAPSDAPAGSAMFERAWLIERFLPQAATAVGPLCPWNDSVAALQFDIMRTAFAEGGGARGFDAQVSVFR